MTCHNCKVEAVKAGRGRKDIQRWKCQQCGKRFSDPQEKLFDGDVRLPKEKVVASLIFTARVRLTSSARTAPAKSASSLPKIR